MKRKIIFTFLMIVFLINQGRTTESLPVGVGLLKKQQDLSSGYGDLRCKGFMTLFDSDHTVLAEHEFTLIQKEKTKDQTGALLLRILKPADLQGVGFLALEDPAEKESDQWLFLPANQKTKRISGASKGGRFLGSEFTFEDLLPSQPQNYQTQTSAQKSCRDTTCYVLDQISLQPEKSLYSRLVTYLRADNFQPDMIEFYNNKGVLFKKALLSDYKFYEGRFWRPQRILMQDLKTHHSTELRITEIQFHNHLNESDFSFQALERH